MASEATFPVQVLREHTTALEAGLSVCLSEATHKAVHRLRTETRRVEAQLVLLAQVPEIPEHRDEANGLRKELKRLRRAAGEVRDLDVHRKLLEEYAEPKGADHDLSGGGHAVAGSPNGAGKARARDASGKAQTKDGAGKQSSNGAETPEERALRKGAGDLRAHMRKQRDEVAEDLQKLLKQRQTKVSAAAEELLKTLDHAEDLPLSVDDLMHHVCGLVERDGLLERGDMTALSKDELHGLRKSAKAARYLAETLPDDPAAAEAAERYEALQDIGGQWHDLLEVAKASRRYLGKNHELTVKLSTERDRKLEEYRTALQKEVRGDARPREDGLAVRRKPKGERRARTGSGRNTARASVRAKGRG